MGWLAFAPVVDRWTRNKEFSSVPDTPENLLAEKLVEFDPEFAYMSGVTRDEWSEFVCEFTFRSNILFNKILINIFSITISVADEELKPKNWLIDDQIFHKKVTEFVKIYNSTLDQESLIRAIKFMYSPWSDPNNLTLIRQGYIDVIPVKSSYSKNLLIIEIMIRC